MEIQVIKKDGSLENFEKGKIERVTVAAGLSPEEAKNLAASVENWAKTSGKNQIATLQIREQVLKGLNNLNQFAANAFVWYEKTKDHGLNSGESE